MLSHEGGLHIMMIAVTSADFSFESIHITSNYVMMQWGFKDEAIEE